MERDEWKVYRRVGEVEEKGGKGSVEMWLWLTVGLVIVDRWIIVIDGSIEKRNRTVAWYY